eukprot:g7726.t1
MSNGAFSYSSSYRDYSHSSGRSVGSKAGKTGQRKRAYIDRLQACNDVSALWSTVRNEHKTIKKNTGVLEYALYALSDLINREHRQNNVQRTFLNNGAVEVLLDLLHHYLLVPGVQEAGWGIFSQLINNPPNPGMQDYAGEAGVPLAIASMRKHDEKPFVGEVTCKVLGHFVAGSPPNRKLQEYILERGGVDLIISQMKQKPEEKWLQVEACSALFQLTFDSPIVRRHVISVGGDKCVEDALQNFQYDMWVLKYGRFALEEITKGPNYHAIKIEDKLLPRAAAFLERKCASTMSPDLRGVSVNGVNTNTVDLYDILDGGYVYRKHDDNEKFKITMRVCTSVFKNQMVHSGYSANVLERPKPSVEIMETLAEIAAKNSKIQAMVAARGGIEAVISGMRSRPHVQLVQQNGALALFFLARHNRKSGKKIIDCGGLNVLYDAQENFANYPLVKRWARLALEEIRNYA